MNKHHFDKEPRDEPTLAEFEEVVRSIMAASQPKGEVPNPSKEDLNQRFKLHRTFRE